MEETDQWDLQCGNLKSIFSRLALQFYLYWYSGRNRIR